MGSPLKEIYESQAGIRAADPDWGPPPARLVTVSSLAHDRDGTWSY